MKSESKGEDCNARMVSRRAFLGGAATAAAAFTIVPRHVLGGPGHVPPSDMLNLACVGVGAQGTRVMMDFLKEKDVRVVSVCDVNQESSDYSEWGKNEIRDTEREVLGDANWGTNWNGPTCGREPAKRLVNAYYAKNGRTGTGSGCTAYNDFRELLDKEAGVDAVFVGTTDHWHALVSVTAMTKGKHVFCQKPMTHSITEARRMAQVKSKTKVATQVAIMNEASEATRLLCEWVWGGEIGPVREVHNWSSRPFWPQGIDRPAETQPVPSGLDWDLWLGPAPVRPFSHIYLPFVWRGWFDFGCGAIGDMGNYSFDTIFRVLKLGPPQSVEASSTKPYPETFPAASIIHFYFPEREGMPPVSVHWYDGGMAPARPSGLPDDYVMTGEDHEGLVFVGDQGILMCGFTGENPRLLPASKMKDFAPPAKTLPRSAGAYREWIDACKGGATPPGANFEFESPIVETILLGNIALRVPKKLDWDSANLKVTNASEANQYVDFAYRGGWKL